MAVVRAEQAAVEPRVGGEESAADTEQDAAGVIRFGKRGPVPDGLAALARRECGTVEPMFLV